jgi:DNA replication and repair protein RecF
MVVTRIELRDFRNYEAVDAALGAGLTVVTGPNGAGKTNLLEGIYFALTGRSCRTGNEREVVRIGAPLARAVVTTEGGDGEHVIEVGFEPGQPRRLKIDGAPVDRLADSTARPLVTVFLPDRLDLVKGAPATRRAHLDQVVAALWPARAESRAAYGRALVQRNALLARVRAGAAAPSLLDPWDAELSRLGLELIAARREAAGTLHPVFERMAAELGLPARAEVAYRPRSAAREPDELREELLERRRADLDRGFSTHGPHRDDLALLHDGRSLRSYGSQGQQRTALLALLFAERAALEARGRPVLALLDDVMSELDPDRRARLAELLRGGGQAVVTATEPEHVPGSLAAEAALLRVEDGSASTAAGLVAA